MAIVIKTLQPANGLLYAYDAALAFIKLIFVSVEDSEFDIGTVEDNRMCRYANSEGRIYFNNNFDGNQRVFLIYKT